MGQSFLCLFFISFKFCSNSRLNCYWTEVTNSSLWHVSGLLQHWPLDIPQGVQQKSSHINIIRKWKVSVARKTAKTKSISMLHLTILFLEGVISMTLILVWKYIFFFFWVRHRDSLSNFHKQCFPTAKETTVKYVSFPWNSTGNVESDDKTCFDQRSKETISFL